MAETETFSAEEKAAMKQRVAEVKAQRRSGAGAKKAEADLQACLDAIAALSGTDKEVAELLHRIVTTTAPSLAPKTWYGFPSYANADGKVIVFCKPGSKFKVRYTEVGFNEHAALDDGSMWPSQYAIVAVDDDVERKLTELVSKAAG